MNKITNKDDDIHNCSENKQIICFRVDDGIWLGNSSLVQTYTINKYIKYQISKKTIFL